MLCSSPVPLVFVQRKSLETFTVCHWGLHSLKYNNTSSGNSKQNYFLPTDLSIIIGLGSCQSVSHNPLEISHLLWISVFVSIGQNILFLILTQVLLHKGMSTCRSLSYVGTYCFGDVVHLILLLVSLDALHLFHPDLMALGKWVFHLWGWICPPSDESEGLLSLESPPYVSLWVCRWWISDVTLEMQDGVEQNGGLPWAWIAGEVAYRGHLLFGAYRGKGRTW